jgi:hypothetical protein
MFRMDEARARFIDSVSKLITAIALILGVVGLSIPI